MNVASLFEQHVFSLFIRTVTVTVPKISPVLQQSKPCCLNVDLEPIVTSPAHDSRYFCSLFCDICLEDLWNITSSVPSALLGYIDLDLFCIRTVYYTRQSSDSGD